MGKHAAGVKKDEPTWLKGSWMQTYTGRQFYPTDPKVEDIDPLDIAHSLSLQCRYNGHVKEFYSVAEHCVLMSYAMTRDYDDKELALWALLHDATEAYVGDMVRPLKIQIPVFSEIEDKVMEVIAEKFGLSTAVMPPEVKDADSRILLDEKAALMGKAPGAWSVDGLQPLRVYIKKWEPKEARLKYAARLMELTQKEFVIY